MPSIFSPQQLEQIVRETLPSSPGTGYRNAVVAGVDKDGAKVVAHFTLGTNSNWRLDAAYAVDYSGERKAGAKLVYAW